MMIQTPARAIASLHAQVRAVLASLAEQQASPMGWPVLVVQ